MRRDDLELRYGPRLALHVQRMIEEAGLGYAPPPVVPNTLASLRLGEFARDAGALRELHPRLFRAYWAEGRDIGDVAVLAELAEGVGLDPREAAAATADARYTERVLTSTDAAVRAGVNGVPAWVIDDRLLVPGAQPHKVFERAMAHLGHRPLEPTAIAEEAPGDGPAASSSTG